MISLDSKTLLDYVGITVLNKCICNYIGIKIKIITVFKNNNLSDC